MSRDQRPRRTVMIDTGPLDTPARVDDAGPGGGGGGVGGGVGDGAIAAPPAPAWSTVMLWATLFLLACAAGAAGVALMLVAR